MVGVPAQTGLTLAVMVAIGNGNTVTLTVSFIIPQGVVIEQEYVVVAVGVAIGFAILALLNPVVGVQA